MIKPDLRPWFPFKWDQHIRSVYALKALQAGEATKEQQREALDFIITKLCNTYDMTFIPDSTRDSDFAEGKRFVGNQIIKLLKLSGPDIEAARKAVKPRK